MALPAGRYGVTKNQLLKIKKLPMNTIKLIEELAEKFDLLGSAAFKNSTSVVTQSTDLVESGAVKDAIVGTVGWIGGRNLLNLTLDKIKTNNSAYTWSGDILTHNGGSISFIESDGFVTGIAISGTVTSDFNVRLTDTDNLGYQGKILNGTVDEDKEYLYAYDETLQNSAKDTGDGVTIPNTFTRYRIALNVKAGTHNNEVVYPMISVNGGAYEPYHESVSDSLAEKADNSVIAPVENGTTASQAYSAGRGFMHNGQFRVAKSGGIASGATISDNNSDVKTIESMLIKQATFSGTTSIQGNLRICNNLTDIILAVKFNTEYIFSAGVWHAGTEQGIHVVETNGEIYTEQAVSGTYYYI